MEGSGGQTAVDGERTIIDFVINHLGPGTITATNRCAHDLARRPRYPTVAFFRHVREGYHEDEQPIDTPDGDSSARYGANMFPVDYKSSSPVSPLFAYPYARALEAMKQRDK